MKLNKSSVAIFLTLLVGIIFFLLYQKYQELNTQTSDAIQAIPINASLLIETNNWNNSLNELENTTIWTTISKSENWSEIKTTIQKLSDEVMANESLKHLSAKQKIYLSAHHSTNDFYFFIATSCSADELKLIESKDSLIDNYKTREYDGVRVFELENNWNLCHHQDILFLSSSSLLIEDGIRQLNNGISLLDNSEFRKVQSTKSTFAGAHIYINYAYLSKLLSQNTTFSKSNEKWMSRWANWAELDLEISENNLTLSGFTLVEDSSSNYLTSLFGQTEQKIEISKVAPRNTYKITALGIEDFNLFYYNYKEFLAKHNNLYEHNKALLEIKSLYDLDAESYFNGIVLNEIGNISTFSSSGKYDDYIFIKTKKESEELLNHINPKTEKKPFSENYRDYTISKFEIDGIFSKLYGHIFKSVKENYFTWIDGYLIFANSPSSIKAFINNFMSKKVLDNNSTFINFKDQIGSRCNYLFYTNPSMGNWNDLLSSKWSAFAPKENWSNVSGFVYQLSSKNELFYNNVVLHYESNLSEETQLDWIVNFDNNIAIAPQIVLNHVTKKKNIIVQDDEKVIYLVDSKGKILWQKKLGGLILDDINQLDYYKNGKLQYIFNTEDSLYILDRLGRNVENFPLSLNEKAERGHSLLDYDNNRKYRILVPSENGMVYNYSKEGKTIAGWQFEKMNNAISHQIQYTNIKGKDYIYTIDKQGHTNIVGRNGKRRVEIGKIPVKDSFYVDENTGNIYTSDTNGNIWLITLKNTQTKIKTSELNDFEFYAAKLNNDEFMDVFISDNTGVKCYNLESEILDFKIISESKPKVFNFKNQSIIGFSSNGSCYLFDSEGKAFSGSPLFGGGDFECVDLDIDNKLNLIVVNGNILNNYSLE
jgi:hypothetical protein